MSKGSSHRALRSVNEFKNCSLPEQSCPYCNKKTSSKNGLSRHLQYRHQSVYLGKQLLQRVMQGTELAEPVEEGIICGVCWLRVEKEGYVGHLRAHLQIAQLEEGFLPRLIGQMAKARF